MAYGLWAECEDSASAERLASHFVGMDHTLFHGRRIVWRVERCGDGDVHAVDVWTAELSRAGVRTVADVLEASEAGIRLFHHLLSAPDFLYARIDWEAANIPLAELPEYIASYPDGERRLRVSCVLRDTALEQLGPLPGFRPFRPGYSWLPYRGESYHPLDSADHPELGRICAELLRNLYEQ